MRVMIVVTHLLGTGHLARALVLGRAFSEAGHSVTVVSGGFPAPQLAIDGVALVQLPPLRSDGTNFSRLLGEAGEADKTLFEARIAALLDALHEVAPDLLITELYPFGRRGLRHEFSALLEAASARSPRPVVLASIRDILAPPSRPEKATKAAEIVTRYYDGVLVHSDPSVTRLDASWPTQGLEDKLLYTGYVAPARPYPVQDGTGEILVSAGGGPVGVPIFRAAIEAARKITNRRWRLLVGGTEAATLINMLAPLARDLPVKMEPARPDFRGMLCNAACSVSMCGYNTALDILQTGVPAVMVPFDDGKEIEQSLRAESLAHLDAVEVLPTADLDGDTLAAAVDRAMQGGRRAASTLQMDGARRSVEIAERMVGQ
ncbi:glycosyltransferase family protein [Lutimaribacter marinistellae]|uniref:Glycosyltransferase family protein n=1 Tax=Lutimaribacter marinistellae TaxID=1820329 RepID=A0ABV7TKT8_9RHOB